MTQHRNSGEKLCLTLSCPARPDRLGFTPHDPKKEPQTDATTRVWLLDTAGRGTAGTPLALHTQKLCTSACAGTLPPRFRGRASANTHAHNIPAQDGFPRLSALENRTQCLLPELGVRFRRGWGGICTTSGLTAERLLQCRYTRIHEVEHGASAGVRQLLVDKQSEGRRDEVWGFIPEGLLPTQETGQGQRTCSRERRPQSLPNRDAQFELRTEASRSALFRVQVLRHLSSLLGCGVPQTYNERRVKSLANHKQRTDVDIYKTCRYELSVFGTPYVHTRRGNKKSEASSHSTFATTPHDRSLFHDTCTYVDA